MGTWECMNYGQYYYSVYQGCRYKIELWGANGGIGCERSYGCRSNGGRGSYISAEYTPSNNREIIIIVGGKGVDGFNNFGGPGGYNGGGSGGDDRNDYDAPGGGGGATDIRTSSSPSTRILVAGGGSGGVCDIPGAPGGKVGLNGIRLYDGVTYGNESTYGSGSNIGGNGNDGSICPGSGSGGGWVGGRARDAINIFQKYHEAIGYGGSNGFDASYVSLTKECGGEDAPEKPTDDGMARITMTNYDSPNCKRPRPSPTPMFIKHLRRSTATSATTITFVLSRGQILKTRKLKRKRRGGS